MKRPMNDNKEMVFVFIVLGCFCVSALLVSVSNKCSNQAISPNAETQDTLVKVVAPDSIKKTMAPTRDNIKPKYTPRLVWTGNGFIWM